MSSFAEVRIAAERLEVTEFGPQVADAVRALVAAGDYTALPPGAPSGRRRSTRGWPTACTGTGARVAAST